MMHLYLAAGGSGGLFQMGHTLLVRFGGLLGLALILFVAIKAMHHMANDRPAVAIVTLLLAIIPAWLILNPQGALHALQSTLG